MASRTNNNQSMFEIKSAALGGEQIEREEESGCGKHASVGAGGVTGATV